MYLDAQKTGSEKRSRPNAVEVAASSIAIPRAIHKSVKLNPMTSPNSQARLIIDPPCEGVMNMAIDQSILETTAVSGQTTLRFYSWNPATLSLGYFQKLEDRAGHTTSMKCPVVRRSSGGGAILHDDELTYSLCIATKDSIAKANAELYDIAHLAIKSSLAEQGIVVELFEGTEGESKKASKDDPFLCFERRADGDLICDGAKIGGSAQRRLKNALIQHGSLLLSQSKFAPELPGLKEKSGIEIDVDLLIDAVTEKLEASLELQFSKGKLTASESQRAAEIVQEKFSAENWTARR